MSMTGKTGPISLLSILKHPVSLDYNPASSYQYTRSKPYRTLESSYLVSNSLMDNQPNYNSLKRRFGIQVLTPGAELTEQGLETLNESLSLISILRPHDLLGVDNLMITHGSTRDGGDRKGSRVRLYSPFGNPPSNRVSGGYRYSIDSDNVHLRASIEVYLLHLLAHEIGHVVQQDAVTYYERLFPGVDRKTIKEWNAEDYRLHLVSGGQHVMEMTSSGSRVGHREERLKYMREQFPLAA